MKGFARDEVFDRRARALRMQIEIEHFLPHGDEETKVTLLSGVLLRDFYLDSFVCLFQSSEQRRNRFARLEVDGTVLDLQHHVVVELAVEWMKNVIGGAGAIILRITPVQVMVVDERSIEHHAAMRFECPRESIRCVRGCASVARWS